MRRNHILKVAVQLDLRSSGNSRPSFLEGYLALRPSVTGGPNRRIWIAVDGAGR